MTKHESFGSQLRAARQAAGLTQTEAASRAGTDQGRWSKWEADKIVPDVPSLAKIGEALGCTVLIEGKDKVRLVLDPTPL